MGFFSEARAFAPSKRVGSLMIVVIAVVVAVLIFRSESSADNKKAMRVVLSDEKTPRPTAEEKDTDGDTLKDWEEELWNLSPVNADTDGDGTSDSQEVENRKRALVDVPAMIVESIDPNDPEQNAIDIAGKILMTQLIAAKKTGVNLTEEEVVRGAKTALESVDLERSYPFIARQDLNIVETPVSTKDYGNGVGRALLNTDDTSTPNEFFVMLSYIQSSDLGKFQKDMIAVIKRYDKTIAGLKSMLVPVDRADDHLKLVNAVIAVRTDLVDISKITDNPLISTIALEAYEKNSANMIGLFKRLRSSLLDASDTIFVNGDAGYEFIHAGAEQ